MKVLIVYASAGLGHKRASDAIYKVFKELNKNDVFIIDSLNYTNLIFKWVYLKSHLFLVSQFPFLWRLLYNLSDSKKLYPSISILRKFINKLSSKKFVKFLCELNPDLIISTHFFASEVISNLKREKRLRSKLVTIITDFNAHYFWLSRWSDLFIVALQDTKEDLIRKGIDEDKIKVLGVPIDPVFSAEIVKEEIDKKSETDGSLFTILMISGGFGIGPIKRLAHRLSSGLEGRSVQLIIVCGRNIKLYKKIKKIELKLTIPIKVYGFVNNIEEFLGKSDLIITKPGGLTSSEALAKKLPMVIVSPIPGQEMKNCEILMKYGAGIRINRLQRIDQIIMELIDSPEKIDKMKKDIEQIARPNAAREIVEALICN